MRVGGQLNLAGAQIGDTDGFSVAAEDLVAARSVFLRKVKATACVHMAHATVGGNLELTGAVLNGEPEWAFNGERLRVDRSMACDDVDARGGFRLTAAHVCGQLSFDAATIAHRGSYAIEANELVADSSMHCRRGFSAMGQIDLRGARINGQLAFDDATLTNESAVALDCAGMVVTGDLIACNMRTEGEIHLMHTHLTGQIDLDDACLSNKGAMTVDGHGLTVGQSILCQRTAVDGSFHLAFSDIGGQLAMVGTAFDPESDAELTFEESRAGHVILMFLSEPPGGINFARSHVGRLTDFPDQWPVERDIEGLTYDALTDGQSLAEERANPKVEVARRLRWVEGSKSGYSPEAYEQLIAFMRRAGRDEDARRIAIAKQRRRRERLNAPARAWSIFLGATIGYGYRTWLAGIWLLGFIVAGALIFGAAEMKLLQPASELPSFKPAIYSLDVLLPIVDLGQQRAREPTGFALWWFYVSIIVGWVLTSAVVASLSGLLKRE